MEESNNIHGSQKTRRWVLTKISEMRPISVRQEFGKIASKILANRLGDKLLQNPTILSRAQRAFLKDGSTSQCVNILLNIFEDFHEKRQRNPKSQLFVVAYDQVKAYDSIQAYSIQASLEDSIYQTYLSDMSYQTLKMPPVALKPSMALRRRYRWRHLFVKVTPCLH